MQSTKFETGPMGRAERQFREAFERLKTGVPVRLSKGTKVSQNNVARESGVEPSALRAARFPNLVAEIKKWVSDNHDTPDQQATRQSKLAQRTRNQSLKIQLEVMRVQRDDALSKLVNAEARIVSLSLENERMRGQLPQSRVVPIRPAER